MRKYLILLVLFLGCRKVETTFQRTGNTSDSKLAINEQPNIILIIGDDVGYELLTCNGGQSYRTPNLDKMASQGARFINCHGAPVCAPSRFMLLTGKYNFRNYTQWGHMDTTNRTIGNMLQDAGYSTCYAGKWQLDGYDAAIRALGFEKYSIWDPGLLDDAGNRYKNPHIYQDGEFLPDSVTLDKYSEDWYSDYIFDFMREATKPYFVCYSMNLVHEPFSPTPDDAEFATWDPNNESDKQYFPSMVKYMDKLVGRIMDSAKRNTIIIYIGDNGTPSSIKSKWNDIRIEGGKGETTIYGTHVPLIVYEKRAVPRIDTSLVDFTDFLPTLASIANIPAPTTYGILDGMPFYPQPGQRPWIFCHFEPHPGGTSKDVASWVHDRVYKRYGPQDTLGEKKNRLYNIVLDPDELEPLKRSKQTPEEKIIDSTFKALLDMMKPPGN